MFPVSVKLVNSVPWLAVGAEKGKHAGCPRPRPTPTSAFGDGTLLE